MTMLTMTGTFLVVASCALAGVVLGMETHASDDGWLAADDPRIAIMGRADRTSAGRIRIGYPGVTVRLRFEGTTVAARLASNSGHTHVGIVVDGAEPRIMPVAQGVHDYVLAEGLGSGVHLVDVVHRTETWQGILTVIGFQVPPPGTHLNAPTWPQRRLLVIGDSVTCGEGVDRGADCSKNKFAMSNGYDSYGMRLARRLDAQVHLVCYGGRGLVRDWRGRSDVLTGPQLFDLALPEENEGGPPAPAWDNATYVPDAVIVSLGTNDFNLSIGPLPERDVFVPAYVAFVRRLRDLYPAAHVFLTEGAIVNDGDETGPRPRSVLREHIDATIEAVSDARVHHLVSSHFPGDECDAHPTGDQHRLMAQEIEPQIRAVLGW